MFQNSLTWFCEKQYEKKNAYILIKKEEIYEHGMQETSSLLVKTSGMSKTHGFNVHNNPKACTMVLLVVHILPWSPGLFDLMTGLWKEK